MSEKWNAKGVKLIYNVLYLDGFFWGKLEYAHGS